MLRRLLVVFGILLVPIAASAGGRSLPTIAVEDLTISPGGESVLQVPFLAGADPVAGVAHEFAWPPEFEITSCAVNPEADSPD
jgi:hypothetical protein